jgi:hypothetical protein
MLRDVLISLLLFSITGWKTVPHVGTVILNATRERMLMKPFLFTGSALALALLYEP